MLRISTHVSCNYPLVPLNRSHNFTTLAHYPCKNGPNFLTTQTNSSKLLGLYHPRTLIPQKGAFQICQSSLNTKDLLEEIGYWTMFYTFDFAPDMDPVLLTIRGGPNQVQGERHPEMLLTEVSSEKALVQVLECKIRCEEEVAVDIPAEFPFKIKDCTGKGLVELTRKYGSETIEVCVYMPDYPDDGKEDDDDSEEYSLPFLIKICRDARSSMKFWGSATPDEIHIKDLYFEDKGYREFKFWDLDKDIQKAFHRYLNVRGITLNATNFMHKYMVNKYDREYKMWLKNLKVFVEA